MVLHIIMMLSALLILHGTASPVAAQQTAFVAGGLAGDARSPLWAMGGETSPTTQWPKDIPVIAKNEKDGLTDTMVLVPAGEFLMGSQTDEGGNGEDPLHRVYLDAFFVDVYEVTVARFARFLEATGQAPPDKWGEADPAVDGNRPVIGVTWYDADAYCRWSGKRLPTEAEWEKAARGTDGRPYPWGQEPPTERHANFGTPFWDGYATLSAVGSYEMGKSPYGVYDMVGNVWEWVADWYDGAYYRNSPHQNPQGPPDGLLKVVRGASWFSQPQVTRAAFRGLGLRRHWDNKTGIRCARTPP